MTERDDDALDVTAEQQEALATFERHSEVFATLGSARVDDGALMASWVTSAVADAGGVTAAAAAGTTKLWLVIGVVALVAGAVTVGVIASQAEPVSTEELAPLAERADATSREQPPSTASLPAAAAATEPIAPMTVPDAEPTSTEAKSKARSRPEKPATTAEPGASAAELLRKAGAARRVGDKPGALALYRRIGREYADSREDTVARVAIGRIELDLGRPAHALEAFDVYLRDRPTGNLAEEASFGRASALRAMGRNDDERAALTAFVAAYPDSVHLPRARARLAKLGG